MAGVTILAFCLGTEFRIRFVNKLMYGFSTDFGRILETPGTESSGWKSTSFVENVLKYIRPVILERTERFALSIL